MSTGGIWASLRFRLAAALLFVIAVIGAASVAIDRVALPQWIPASDEPLQDSLVLAASGLAGLGLIVLIVAWSLRPVSRASALARRVGPRHPGMRLDMAGLPSEIAPLLEAVNGALDRLEAAYQSERMFTADAAHALRTPLSVLALRLQRARLEKCFDWEGIDADMRHMTALVSQLLDLARKEQAHDAAPERVNLARLAREAAASILPLVHEAGREITVSAPDEVFVSGRGADLRDALANGIDNALRHGAGAIVVDVRRSGDSATVDITDQGAGVPRDKREAIFRRFAKLKEGSPGTGLGLAIVRAVAESHGGSVLFRDTEKSALRLQVPVNGPPTRP